MPAGDGRGEAGVGEDGQAPLDIWRLGSRALCSISRGCGTAETIIAVNTDPEAPIFGVAHYGAVLDMFELADELEQALD